MDAESEPCPPGAGPSARLSVAATVEGWVGAGRGGRWAQVAALQMAGPEAHRNTQMALIT